MWVKLLIRNHLKRYEIQKQQVLFIVHIYIVYELSFFISSFLLSSTLFYCVIVLLFYSFSFVFVHFQYEIEKRTTTKNEKLMARWYFFQQITWIFFLSLFRYTKLLTAINEPCVRVCERARSSVFVYLCY